jgi:hypothetical protein
MTIGHVYKWASGQKKEEDLKSIKVDGFVYIDDGEQCQ